MAKKARLVSFLICLGFGGLFSIEIFANQGEMEENAGYGRYSMEQRAESELNQISDEETAGLITPQKAEQLRLEVEAILQKEQNAQLPTMQFQTDEIFQELNDEEQVILQAGKGQ